MQKPATLEDWAKHLHFIRSGDTVSLLVRANFSAEIGTLGHESLIKSDLTRFFWRTFYGQAMDKCDALRLVLQGKGILADTAVAEALNELQVELGEFYSRLHEHPVKDVGTDPLRVAVLKAI